jgi:hypothetical protein
MLHRHKPVVRFFRQFQHAGEFRPIWSDKMPTVSVVF